VSEASTSETGIGFGYDELKDFDDGIVPFLTIGH